MPTFSNRDKEILSSADNLVHEKVTALGADGYSFSEPYPNEPVFPLGRVMRSTPDGYNGNEGLVAPNYSDYPVEGAIGTRHETIRLHSYLPSGLTGPDSCQTFFTISSAPASNSIVDIDAVRLKPLISPVFSPRKKNAADPDTYIRGFELALYPAKDSGGTLEADTANGPISPLADPGASESSDSGAGAGYEGFWYVDYDNGIVRFSRPPLNGSDGVMNPNNVFGDINGSTDAYGAITMYATIYHYTGEFGIQDDPDVVTVGDGYVSTGAFTGVSSNVIQAAINSLPGEGGTVFIKEGQYDYTIPVEVPAGVHVVGLGGVKVVRPRREPAFAIMDGYSSVENIEIHPRDGLTNGGAIEIRCNSSAQNITNIKIVDNVIHVEDDAYGISFAPVLSNPSYTDILIENNMFVADGTKPNSIAISETPRGQKVNLSYITIKNNSFQINDLVSSPYAIKIGGGVVDQLSYLYFQNNNIYNAEININPFTALSNILVSGNITYGASVNVGNETQVELNSSTIAGNKLGEINAPNIQKVKVIGNHFIGTNHYIGASNGAGTTYMEQCEINDNTFEGSGTVHFGQPTNTTVSNNLFSNSTDIEFIDISTGPASITGNLIDGYFSSSGDGIVSTNISGNTISSDFTLDSTGYATSESLIDNNHIGGNIAINAVVYNSTISDNFVTGTFTLSGAIGSNLIGNVVGTNNAPQSISLHIYDGYVTTDPINNIIFGAGIQATGTNGTDDDGVYGIGGTTNGNGVKGLGTGTGGGIYGTGGSSNGTGVEGVGGGSQGTGVKGTGQEDQPGVHGIGGSSNGAGVYGAGGASDGVGVYGLGDGEGSGVAGTGGDNSGKGVYGLGGSSDGIGVVGDGRATGEGVKGTGGASDGYGVHGIGGNSNGVGVYGAGKGTGTGVVGYGGSSNGAGIYGIGDGTAVGIRGEGGASGGAGISGTGGTSSGTGVYGAGGASGGIGVEGVGGSSGSGTGVQGTAGSNNGTGIKGYGTGTGSGVYGEGGDSDGTGVYAQAGSTNGDGVYGQSTGTGIGVYGYAIAPGGVGVRGENGASGDGINGIGASNGRGVYGAAEGTAAAVEGIGSGSGAGVHGQSAGTGYGIIAEADTSSPARASLRLVPQDSAPSSPQEGDIYINSSDHHFYGYNGSGWVQLDN